MQKLYITLVMTVCLAIQATQAGAFTFHHEKSSSIVFAAEGKDEKGAPEEEPEPDCD